jgi:hypothetical protein
VVVLVVSIPVVDGSPVVFVALADPVAGVVMMVSTPVVGAGGFIVVAPVVVAVALAELPAVVVPVVEVAEVPGDVEPVPSLPALSLSVVSGRSVQPLPIAAPITTST